MTICRNSANVHCFQKMEKQLLTIWKFVTLVAKNCETSKLLENSETCPNQLLVFIIQLNSIFIFQFTPQARSKPSRCRSSSGTSPRWASRSASPSSSRSRSSSRASSGGARLSSLFFLTLSQNGFFSNFYIFLKIFSNCFLVNFYQ